MQNTCEGYRQSLENFPSHSILVLMQQIMTIKERGEGFKFSSPLEPIFLCYKKSLACKIWHTASQTLTPPLALYPKGQLHFLENLEDVYPLPSSLAALQLKTYEICFKMFWKFLEIYYVCNIVE